MALELGKFAFDEGARSVFKNIVSVVNQNSTPMIRTGKEEDDKKRVFIMHDNRIYVFIVDKNTKIRPVRGASHSSPASNNSVSPCAVAGVASPESKDPGAEPAYTVAPPDASGTNNIQRMDIGSFVLSVGSYQDSRLIGSPRVNASGASNNCSPEQDLILSILATTEFRCYQATYTLFRILDNTALLAIIVLSIMSGTLREAYEGWTSQIVLVCAVGIEIFYDVMLNTNKYWCLQRLSIYIGLFLFAVYFAVVASMRHSHYYQLNQDGVKLVFVILCLRLLTFLLEEFVDYGIDCALHNALTDIFGNNKREMSIPTSTVYEGSFFAWGFYTMHEWEANQDGQRVPEKQPSGPIVALDDGTDLEAPGITQPLMTPSDRAVCSNAEEGNALSVEQEAQQEAQNVSVPIRRRTQTEIQLKPIQDGRICCSLILPGVFTVILAAIIALMGLVCAGLAYPACTCCGSSTKMKLYFSELFEEFSCLRRSTTQISAFRSWWSGGTNGQPAPSCRSCRPACCFGSTNGSMPVPNPVCEK
jgi:hypothetical protein